MEKYTEKDMVMFERDEYGRIVCPSGDYTQIESFGEWCRFGERCSFGEWCSFVEGCSFNGVVPSILRAQIDSVSNTVCLELMRRDAWCHPNPEKFDEWAKGGNCPYKNGIQRMHFFKERRELWKPGPPQMRDYDLLMEICRLNKWTMGDAAEKTDAKEES